MLGAALPSLAESFTVRATSDLRWSPTPLTITKGDRVTWTNPTSQRHQVLAYSNNWSKRVTLEPGETTSKRFRKTGRYKYYCDFHANVSGGECTGPMCGVVRVTRP